MPALQGWTTNLMVFPELLQGFEFYGLDGKFLKKAFLEGPQT